MPTSLAPIKQLRPELFGHTLLRTAQPPELDQAIHNKTGNSAKLSFPKTRLQRRSICTLAVC